MQTVYKIFLVLFIVFIGFNLYSIEWDLGFMNEENSKFIFSLSAGVLGLLLVIVLNSWSRLALNK